MINSCRKNCKEKGLDRQKEEWKTQMEGRTPRSLYTSRCQIGVGGVIEKGFNTNLHLQYIKKIIILTFFLKAVAFQLQRRKNKHTKKGYTGSLSLNTYLRVINSTSRFVLKINKKKHICTNIYVTNNMYK